MIGWFDIARFWRLLLSPCSPSSFLKIAGVLLVSLVTLVEAAGANPLPISNANRTFECTFEPRKLYQDPFNNVNVDVIFTRNGESCRVPALCAVATNARSRVH